MSNNIYEYLIDEIEAELLPNLARFVKIENQSRNFDSHWEENGLLEKACKFVLTWAGQQGLKNAKFELLQEKGRTPTILGIIEPPKKAEKTILIYGHIDKQPPLTEQWHDGKKPYVPIYENEKLYGRGAGDDGYAFFSAVLLVKALQKYDLQKHRFVLFFESDEESDSKDLIYFLEQSKNKIKQPDIVICLDAGGLDDEHFPLTNSLRGIFDCQIKISVLKNSVHSGLSSGIVPDSFRIIRHFLRGIENTDDGSILIDDFNTNIPESHYKDAVDLVESFKGKAPWVFPFLPGVEPTVSDIFDQYLNGSWKPQMTMIGVDGIPNIQTAGNVIRPYTTLDLSFRLPPNLSSDVAEAKILDYVAKHVPLYDAKIECFTKTKGNGFLTNKLPAELSDKIDKASQEFFGTLPAKVAVGGSIPFMGELKTIFPDAVFIVTGIMGPNSGMHGPNEYADIKFLKKLMLALLYVLS